MNRSRFCRTARRVNILLALRLTPCQLNSRVDGRTFRNSDRSGGHTKTFKMPKVPKTPFESGQAKPPRSRLVEHSNPAHANPTAQVLAARRDDRPATRRRTTGRKHRFIDRIRALHNRYIATPINARNGRPEELDRGYTPLRGLRRRRHCGGAGTAADLRRLWSGGGPTPARPIGETADQRLRAQRGGDARCTTKRLSLIQLYNTYICSLYVHVILFLYSKGYSVHCAS